MVKAKLANFPIIYYTSRRDPSLKIRKNSFLKEAKMKQTQREIAKIIGILIPEKISAGAGGLVTNHQDKNKQSQYPNKEILILMIIPGLHLRDGTIKIICLKIQAN